MVNSNEPKPKGRRWKRVVILAALPILIIAIMVALTLPFLPSGGWSKDVKLSSGSMNMRVQFKTNPVSPTVGPVTLMARVKNEAAFTSRVNQLVFNYSMADQQFAQSIEGAPAGEFGMQGEGFYTADAELPLPGDWLVEVWISHAGATLSTKFPLKVNQQ